MDLSAEEQSALCEHIKDLFRNADLNQDGKIDRSELMGILKPAVKEFTEEQLNVLFDVADTNHDGTLNYLEFFDWVFSADSSEQPELGKSVAELLLLPAASTPKGFSYEAKGPWNVKQAYDVKGSFTMSARIIATQNDSQGGRILAKRAGSAGWEFVAPRWNGLVSFFGAGQHRDVGSTRVDDGQWHHVAVVYRALSGEMSSFVDGCLDGKTTFSGKIEPQSDVDLWLGVRGGAESSDVFLGNFKDVNVYNWPLTEKQIKSEAQGDALEVDDEVMLTVLGHCGVHYEVVARKTMLGIELKQEIEYKSGGEFPKDVTRLMLGKRPKYSFLGKQRELFDGDPLSKILPEGATTLEFTLVKPYQYWRLLNNAEVQPGRMCSYRWVLKSLQFGDDDNMHKTKFGDATKAFSDSQCDSMHGPEKVFGTGSHVDAGATDYTDVHWASDKDAGVEPYKSYIGYDFGHPGVFTSRFKIMQYGKCATTSVRVQCSDDKLNWKTAWIQTLFPMEKMAIWEECSAREELFAKEDQVIPKTFAQLFDEACARELAEEKAAKEKKAAAQREAAQKAAEEAAARKATEQEAAPAPRLAPSLARDYDDSDDECCIM